MSSSSALVFYFYNCAQKGISYAGRKPKELFEALRHIGQEAEKSMFHATGGVNTHKGLVFSQGLICAAASCCIEEKGKDIFIAEDICEKVSEMTQGLCSRELASLNKTENLTYGEKLYRRYGFKGIRGEVESGFPTVRNCSLPILRHLKSMKIYHLNEILIQTLLHIIAVNEDTNIAARHDRETLEYVQQYARQVLDAGGVLSPIGIQDVHEMDEDFIRRNISPGGSADLLAVTVFLDLLTEETTL
jgi:triphosphoribosyl-dephospho-CoA synthase